MSRHPTVEVISRIAPDAAARLDLTTGASWLTVMTVGIVAPARCAPHIMRQVTLAVNKPEPDG